MHDILCIGFVGLAACEFARMKNIYGIRTLDLAKLLWLLYSGILRLSVRGQVCFCMPSPPTRLTIDTAY